MNVSGGNAAIPGGLETDFLLRDGYRTWSDLFTNQQLRVLKSAFHEINVIRCTQSIKERLRVAVVGGGCSGLQYKMDLQDGPANRDILVETAGVRVVVDPKSALYVTGSELDYLEALDGGFKVKNPNAATSCSCGESFSA